MAVGARKYWGTCPLPGTESTIIVPERASAIRWNAVLKGGVDLVSLYFISGEGASEANMEICEEVGCRLAALDRIQRIEHN